MPGPRASLPLPAPAADPEPLLPELRAARSPAKLLHRK